MEGVAYRHEVSQSWAGLIILLAFFLAIIIGFMLFSCFPRTATVKQEFEVLVPMEDLWEKCYLPVPPIPNSAPKPTKYACSEDENLQEVIKSENRQPIRRSWWSLMDQGYVFPVDDNYRLLDESGQTTDSAERPSLSVISDELIRHGPEDCRY